MIKHAMRDMLQILKKNQVSFRLQCQKSKCLSREFFTPVNRSNQSFI